LIYVCFHCYVIIDCWLTCLVLFNLWLH